LAQPFLACHPQAIVVLSSTGPADGRAWLPVEYLAIGLVRLLPEQRVKRLLAGQLGKVLTTDPKDREDWRAGRPRYERLFERHVETISRGRPATPPPCLTRRNMCTGYSRPWPDRDGGPRSTVRSSSPYLGWHRTSFAGPLTPLPRQAGGWVVR
jgi:hypothetical protein